MQWGELAMSLSAWEEKALDSIKDEFTDSDPRLVRLLTAFTQLASGEAMPVRNKIRAGSRRAISYPLRKRRRCCQTGACRNSSRILQSLGVQHALVLAWLLITVTLIAVSVVLGGGSSHGTATQTCAGSWPLACPHSPAG
jgi:hypothetical protein